MTPCEEAVWRTIQAMIDRNGEAANVREISRLSYVSDRHTRRCIRFISRELAQQLIRIVEPGKSARFIVKSKEKN